MDLVNKLKIFKWKIAIAFVFIIGLYLVSSSVPFGSHVFLPDKLAAARAGYAYDIPLDPASPWPKFRNNAPQNGRSQVKPIVDPALRPWTFRTGKGVFSSGVVDANDAVYIGSADHYFYAIHKDGSLKWKFRTGEVIDSSALLDDRGRIYFGSGDAHIYCLERKNAALVWTFKADPVAEVEKRYGIKSYNVDWFEANIAMLKDGTIVAPNDNFLVYTIDRETGKKKAEYLGNELMWSLPAVNVNTGRIFYGSQYMALKNVYCVDTAAGETEWTNGRWGSNVASPLLTSTDRRGAVVLGGFDGYVRAYTQTDGKHLWQQGLRGHIYSSPAQLSDGTIIQPSTDGTVYALEPSTGEIKWAFDTLEPIRSSPAVDGNDRIYVGSGEGRLFCLNAEGTLRWAYLCIDEERNDLNSSPALGKTGVFIAGENGGVFFVPYDYPLGPIGKNDPRCTLGPGEVLSPEGAYMIYTSNFGGLQVQPPREIDANQALAFSLFVREKGDTVKAVIDRDTLKISVTGNPRMEAKISADGHFFMMTPRETWTGPDGGIITVEIKGDYKTNMSRFGLKFFRGSRGGSFDVSYRFAVPGYREAAQPYKIPVSTGDPSTVFEFKRFAAPNPVMLPSWNQIGFDSIHYLGGAVEAVDGRILVWVIPGKLQGDATVVDPTLAARFPLTLEYRGGLLTFYNYDGFKVNFVGSWDMPFGFYRIAAHANPLSGAIDRSPVLNAIAKCDEIEHYGRFLKLMGMSEYETGHMAVFGGLTMALHGRGYETAPAGAGTIEFRAGETSASATVTGGQLKKGDHVFSLLLIDVKTGKAFPLYYTKRTIVEADTAGRVTRVSVEYDAGEVKGEVRAYYMVDTYPAARGELKL
ncbi:MAG: hypothetical protein EPN93_07525 [Spirochaetes bacterium]|nr:MAG: hypothetical protein EPN93_07525 [Spirochaetota bacterium]